MKFTGLSALRQHWLQNHCIISGKSDGLKPAIVIIKRDDGVEMRKDGLVHRSIRAGRRIGGGRIISVTRKNVEMNINKTKKGIAYVDCRVA